MAFHYILSVKWRINVENLLIWIKYKLLSCVNDNSLLLIFSTLCGYDNLYKYKVSWGKDSITCY